MVSVAFTGNRRGMTKKQADGIRAFFNVFCKDGRIICRHGDCVGSDASFHNICREYIDSIKIIIHPPFIDKYRAFCKGDEICESKEYLERNRDMVDLSSILLATPFEMEDQLRSGTWSTIRYAKNMCSNKKILTFLPPGKIEIFQNYTEPIKEIKQTEWRRDVELPMDLRIRINGAS